MASKPRLPHLLPPEAARFEVRAAPVMKFSISRPDRVALAVLLGLCLLFWSRVLFTGQVLLPGAMLSGFAPFSPDSTSAARAPWTILQWDSLAQYFPWRHFAAQSLRSGQIPLWNPFQFSGTPFVANAQSAVFYPLNLPFWLFDTAYAFGIAALLHSVLASFSTYFLMRRWQVSRAAAILAATIYAFCGFLSAWALLPTLFATASWLPLCLILFERAADDETPRAATFWLAISLSCALLAGHAQIFFYIVLALALRQPFLRRKWRGLAILIGVLTLCALLCAIQILPTLELSKLGHRAADRPTADGWNAKRIRALQLTEWPSLLLPNWPLLWGTLSENFGYVGVVAPILAVVSIFGLKRRAVVSADKVPVEAAPTEEPLIEKPTVETKIASIETAPTSTTISVAPRYFALSLGLFGLLYAFATPLAAIFYFAVPGVSQMGGTGRALLLWSFGIAMAAGFGLDFARTKIRSSIFPLVALLLVFGELAFNAFSTQPTAPRAQIYPPTELTTFLAKNTSASARVLMVTPRGSWLPTENFGSSGRTHPPGVLPPNCAMVYGIHDVNGYDSLSIKAYRSWIEGEETAGSSPQLNGNMVLINSLSPALLDSLAVRYVVTLQLAPPPVPPGRKILSANGCDVWQRQMQGELRVTGANFYPGWKDGLYQPETFRFGSFISLCSLLFVTAALSFKRRQ